MHKKLRKKAIPTRDFANKADREVSALLDARLGRLAPVAPVVTVLWDRFAPVRLSCRPYAPAGTAPVGGELALAEIPDLHCQLRAARPALLDC